MIPVRVAVRIRPLITREITSNSYSVLKKVDGDSQVILGAHTFTFDQVFDVDSTQQAVYENSVRSLLDGFFEGCNATVLAYGQTGSGKTYTLGLSSESCDRYQKDGGIIFRLFNDLFDRMEKEKVKYDHNIRVSFLELYKETINDLLTEDMNDNIVIREERNRIKITGLVDNFVSAERTIYSFKFPLKVLGLTQFPVESVADCIKLLMDGCFRRTVAETMMNESSSRSHAIYTIYMDRCTKSSLESDQYDCVSCKFQVVDLAGSERQSRTQAEGSRFKEGVKINLGLLALGNVISLLGGETTCHGHIPYRDSKLTRLLQDSLGGNSHTLMLACVSPANDSADETLNTLRYANRARNIKNKPVANRDSKSTIIAALQQQIEELKQRLKEYGDDCGRMKTERLYDADIFENHTVMTESTVGTLSVFKELQDNLTVLANRYTKNSSPVQSRQLFNNLKNKLKLLDALYNADDNMECEMVAEDSCLTAENEQLSLNQAITHQQIMELDQYIEDKECLLEKIKRNSGHVEDLWQQYEQKQTELENKLNELQKEKEEAEKLASTVSITKRTAEQYRNRVSELESQIAELRKKLSGFEKSIREKEQIEKVCARLQNEVVAIKQQRVQLVKQLKQESAQFRKCRLANEREINKLRALDRKRQFEISKMEREKNSKDSIIQRKNAELTAVFNRLNTILKKQRDEAKKRLMAFDKKDQSLLGEKLRDWFDEEVELFVNCQQASQQIEILWQERQALNDKLLATDASSAILNELESKNQQIEILQGRLEQAGDMELRKNIIIEKLNNFTEAKILFKYAFLQLVQSNVQKAIMDSRLSEFMEEMLELRNALDAARNECRDYEEKYQCLLKNVTNAISAYGIRNLDELSRAINIVMRECGHESVASVLASNINLLKDHCKSRSNILTENQNNHLFCAADENFSNHFHSSTEYVSIDTDEHETSMDWRSTPVGWRYRKERLFGKTFSNMDTENKNPVENK